MQQLPRIRFAQTPDNVTVACWEAGEGVPIVHMPWLPWSHVQLEWQSAELRRWYEELLHEGRLIRYDGRGTGLSDRAHTDLSMEAQLLDLETALRTFGLTRFVLFGPFHSAPAALAYAAQHPERVAGLVIWAGYARGLDYIESPRVATIRALMNDWELFTETAAHAFVGWNAGNTAHELAVLMREGVNHDTARTFLERIGEFDSTPLLGDITMPTVVMHPRTFQLVDVSCAREMALHIKDARFIAVEGESLAPTMTDLPTVMEAMREIIGAVRLEMDEPAPRESVAAPGANSAKLTPREVEVLRLYAGGQNARQIADELVLSVRTVERHIANIYAKVDVNNRSQITSYAIANRII